MVDEGSAITLLCTSVGLQCDVDKAIPTRPYMEISFKSKPRLSQANTAVISLALEDVQMSDSGDYVCQASFHSARPISHKSLTLFVISEFVNVY